jgi:hypothetical protein
MIDGGHTSSTSLLSAPQLACGPTLSLPHTAVSVGTDMLLIFVMMCLFSETNYAYGRELIGYSVGGAGGELSLQRLGLELK